MAGEDRRYSHWVRRQPCARCGATGPSEQHHRTGAGMGMRSHDHESMPLCSNCHSALHNGAMLKDARRRFERRAAAEYRGRYLLENPIEDITPAEDVF